MAFESISNPANNLHDNSHDLQLSLADVYRDNPSRTSPQKGEQVDNTNATSSLGATALDDYKKTVRARILRQDPAPDQPEQRQREVPRSLSDATIALENKLNDDIKNLSDPEKSKFQENMNTFLSRAVSQKLDEKNEIDKTLQDVDQLFNARQSNIDGLMGAQQGEHLRIMLAEQIMNKAAYPSQTDQGVFGTCTIASLETRTWFDKPSVAAGLITEQALTGHWTAPDGKQIALPAVDFKPDAYAEQTVARNGMRNFAGQIFQATAMSDIGSRGHVNDGQEEYYVDGGIDNSGMGIEYWADSKGNKVNAFNGLDDVQTAEELRRMDGDNTEVLCSSPSKPDDHVVKFGSKEELIQKLTEAQEQGKMPVIIVVAAGDPFFGNGGGHDLDHAICIDKYDPVTRTVVVDNQWGSQFDWGTSTVLGSPNDRNTAASIDDFYPATQGSMGLASPKPIHLF